MTLSRILDNNHSFKICKYVSNHCRVSVAVILIIIGFTGQVFAAQDDSDGDGLSDTYELKIGLESYLSDTDGDNVKDSVEVGQNQGSPLDSDNDGVINALDYDDDNDGLPTYLESKKDSDKDGLLDYLDKDSDNDGIEDGEESGFLNQDNNNDGIDDAFDISREGAVDNNGDGIDDNVKLPDHNNDGKPDHLDGKYQPVKLILVKNEDEKNKNNNLEITKSEPEKITVAKTKIVKPKNIPPNPIVNRHSDSDNDGLSNALEKILGTNHLSRDSDGDKVSDAIEIGLDVNSPQDSDHDGIIDALDNDDDNDGVLTKFEDINKDSTPINDDTDADGVPNYLDDNDDGDNLLTIAEGPILDTDGDGILDYLDKNDGVKDISNSSNKTVQIDDENIPAEPEVVVLFDADILALTEEDEIPLEDFETDTILNSLDQELEKNGLDTANKDGLDAVNDVANKDDKNEVVNEKISSSRSSSKKETSHWDLF